MAETPIAPGAAPAAPTMEVVLRHQIKILKAQVEWFKGRAETDYLTRLPNRLGLERRTTARGGWFVLVDLDGFKRAQDIHPDKHTYGDLVLVEFADWLRSKTRSGARRPADRVSARTGGDEFVVWVPTRQAAERVAADVDGWRSTGGEVSASAGIGETMWEADAAMYQKKRSKHLLPRALKFAAEFVRGWIS